MKKYILSLVMLVFSFIGFNQVMEVAFSKNFNFNSDTSSSDFFTIMDSGNVTFNEIKMGDNKYVIDIDNKMVHLYFQGSLYNSKPIKEVKIKRDITIVTMKDIDVNSGEELLVYLAVNENYEINGYPYFTFYFESLGKMTGCVVFNDVK